MRPSGIANARASFDPRTAVPNHSEAVALAAPVFRIGHLDALKASVGTPATIVAYAVPMAIASILTIVAMVALTPKGHLLFQNGSADFVDPTLAARLPLLGVLAPVIFVATVFATAAAHLTSTAALVHRPIGAVAAWRRSARILVRTLPAGLVVLALAAITVAIAAGAVVIGLPAWAAGILLAALVIVLLPALYLIPLTVASRTPISAAFQQIRRLSRAIREEGLLARVPVVLTIAVGTGLTYLVFLLETTTVPSVWTRALFGAATSAIAVLTAVAAIGVLSRLTLEGLSRQEEPGTVDLPSPSQRSIVRSAGAWAVSVTAVVMPFAFLAGTITVNPTNVPVTTAIGFELANIDLVTVDAGDGVIANLSHAYRDYSLAVCVDGQCERAHSLVRHGFVTAIGPAPTGGVLRARWSVGPENADGQEWILMVSTLTALQLTSAGREDVTADNQIELDVTEVQSIDVVGNSDTSNLVDNTDAASLLALSIDTSGEFPVIASFNGLATPGELALGIYRCADAECSSATKQSLTVEIEPMYSSVLSLDLAVASDGTAFATLTGFERINRDVDIHTTTLFTAGIDGPLTATRIIESAPTEDTYEDGWAPSQIVVDSDNTPAVLYRHERSGDFELLVCDDPACSSSTTRTVPGPVSENFVPSMTVDATGRPLIATYSENGRSVVVLSCVDAECSEFETRVVAHAFREITPLHIATSSDGLPIVTIGIWGVEHTIERVGESTAIALCQQARCGAK